MNLQHVLSPQTQLSVLCYRKDKRSSLAGVEQQMARIIGQTHCGISLLEKKQKQNNCQPMQPAAGRGTSLFDSRPEWIPQLPCDPNEADQELWSC